MTNPASTALLTDHYELTMLEAALDSGMGSHRAVFEVFARRLPKGRQYGVVAGTARLLEALERFRFGPTEIEDLRARAVVSERTLEWLSRYRFSGRIDGYAEGDLYFPYSPVLTVESTFAEAVLLETLILSILNYDCAVASAASRMVSAANGASLMEMGSRRTHEEAAVAAARAAYLVGFDATSNLEAARRYGIPTRGTSAHAFTLAHLSEHAAFEAQMRSLGVSTTLLVDTYDIEAAIKTAVMLAQELGATGPGGVRIDSGDLSVEVPKARALLDSLGAVTTKIVVSGDMDEYSIANLVDHDAPVDVYGVGTKLVTGSGAPAAEMVYKLVAIADSPSPNSPLRPVAKRSTGKATIGGRKVAWRVLDEAGYAHEERVVSRFVPPDKLMDTPDARHLQVPLVVNGRRVWNPTLDESRLHHQAAKAELRPGRLAIDAIGGPCLDATPKER